MANKSIFHDTISQQHYVNEAYQSLALTHNQKKIYRSQSTPFKLNDTVLNVALFPNYLISELIEIKGIEVVKMPQLKIKGYAIIISDYNDFETMFKSVYKKSFRSNIMRFVNRLEACFNVRYKLFYGDIATSDYNNLMVALKGMLTTRFNQRNDSNKILNNWQYHLDSTLDMIRRKNASLFVIYNNDVPIHICINYHFNGILFVAIPSFDIDYSKFSLGNISIYKLLEWAVNNNYQVLDMAQGTLEYKRRWSTLIYSFSHHIIYNKLSFKSKLTAQIEIKKLQLKNYLKSKNIDDSVAAIKQKLKKPNQFKDQAFVFEDVDKEVALKQTLITVNKQVNAHLLKPVYDFMFITKTHAESVAVYKTNLHSEYLICGAQEAKKIILR